MHVDNLMTRATVRGHEARAGLEAFGHLLCKAWGLPPIRVTWGPVPTACIDARGHVTLADLGDASTVTRATVARYAGFMLHELLHRRFTSFGARDGRPYVDSLLNAIEDARIERAAIAEGLLGNVRGLLGGLIGAMVQEACAQVQDWADPRQYPFSLAVFLRDYGPLVPVPAALLPVYTEARRRLAACANTEDSLKLARWVFDQMQQPQQPQQNQQQQEDQQEDQEGQDGAQEGPGQEGQGDGTPEDAGEAQRPAASTQATNPEPQAPEGQPVRQAGWRAGASEPTHYVLGEPRAMSSNVPGRLRYEVRRLFENTARDWHEAGFKSGRLSAGSLHRVATGAADVFSRRFETDGIESAAVICIDLSGSMCRGAAQGESLLDIATRAAWALVESLTHAGVDVAILGFTENVHLFRTFGKLPAAQAREKLARMQPSGGTNDYGAVREAHTMLLRHPAARRVCFVLTDGRGNEDDTRTQCQEGEFLGITTIALGIQHDVRGVYGPNAVRVNDLQSLGTVALRQVKRAA